MYVSSVAKGTGIVIPIMAMNRNPDVWANARDFLPERWLSPADLPAGTLEIPSVSFPTFLAGSRACIGFRLTMIEYVCPLLLRARPGLLILIG